MVNSIQCNELQQNLSSADLPKSIQHVNYFSDTAQQHSIAEAPPSGQPLSSFNAAAFHIAVPDGESRAPDAACFMIARGRIRTDFFEFRRLGVVPSRSGEFFVVSRRPLTHGTLRAPRVRRCFGLQPSRAAGESHASDAALTNRPTRALPLPPAVVFGEFFHVTLLR